MKRGLLWIKRIFLGLLGLITLLLITGFIYEHVSRSIDKNKLKPTGEFANVGDHELHYVKRGEDGPTVVFVSGIDLGGHVYWKLVQDEISKYTTTISYDRAGILWSGRGSDPMTLASISFDLYQLLMKADCPKPYILVGHSFAGITLRKFIEAHKQDILGVVFVDVSHPDQMNRMSDELKGMMEMPPRWILDLMFNFGINRLLSKNFYPGIPATDSINIIGNKMSYKGKQATLETFENLESMAREANSISSFDSIALTVITGSSPKRELEISDEKLRPEAKELWNELQSELLNLSPNSKRILAMESSHYVQLEQPEIVIGAIEDLLGQKGLEH